MGNQCTEVKGHNNGPSSGNRWHGLLLTGNANIVDGRGIYNSTEPVTNTIIRRCHVHNNNANEIIVSSEHGI